MYFRTSHCGSVVANLTSIHWTWVQCLALLSRLRIWGCCELWCRSQLWLRFDPWPGNVLMLQVRPWEKKKNLFIGLGQCTWLELSQGRESLLLFIYLFWSFCLFRASPATYGGFQARGPTEAVVSGLRQSHSKEGSEPRLQTTPQLTATPDR